MKTTFSARCVLLIMLFAIAGCKQQLYTSLSERDANEMIAVLAARNLKAEKVTNDKGDFRIELKQSDFSAAVEALRDNGLPRAKFSSIGEVFKKEGLVTTANSERLRFMFAMSEELSKTISLIDGVVEARVHPVLPGGDPLTDKLTPASASVFIKHTPDANLTLLAPAIKDMVSASIEGLTYDKVALTFVPAIKMAAAVPAAQQVFGASPTQGQTSTLFGFPALGLGLASAFLILGIGLFALRRREPADIQQSQRAQKQIRTVQPTMWLAERLSVEIRKAISKIRREKAGSNREARSVQPNSQTDQTQLNQSGAEIPASRNASSAGSASK